MTSLMPTPGTLAFWLVWVESYLAIGLWMWMGVGYLLSFRGWRLWPWLWPARRHPTTEWPVGKVYPVLLAELKVEVPGRTEAEDEESPSPSRQPGFKNVLRVVFTKEGVHLGGSFPVRTFLFDKPLLLPWESVRSVAEKKDFLRGRHYLMVVEGPVEVGRLREQGQGRIPMRIRLWLPAKVEAEQEFSRHVPRERLQGP